MHHFQESIGRSAYSLEFLWEFNELAASGNKLLYLVNHLEKVFYFYSFIWYAHFSDGSHLTGSGLIPAALMVFLIKSNSVLKKLDLDGLATHWCFCKVPSIWRR